MSVIAVNVTRISLMGLSHWHYEVIHSELGGMVANFIMLCLTIGFSVLGARRELFSRASVVPSRSTDGAHAGVEVDGACWKRRTK